MSRIAFANILLERHPRSIEYPALYCRSSSAVIQNDETGIWQLMGRGTFDFTTYFNALSVSKLKRYTTATAYRLHLELKGAACTVTQTTADVLADHSMPLADTTRTVPTSDGWQTVEMDLEVADDAILVGFIIETEGTVQIANSYYEVEFPGEPREVELALATTTFKKETYITSNIALLKREITTKGDEFSKHFHVYVIDNGRTLDAEALTGDNVQVIPNDNVGGAGGFTRGMIAAWDQTPRATHVLLMDDDVAVSPESIRRTYNLLRIVNDEYAEAFVSGAMLNYGVGNEMWEDTGFMTPRGTFAPVKPMLTLTNFEDIVFNESFHLPREVRELNQRYAAWWYCVIPMTQIEKNRLPLPVFVRCDDAEYGVRCQPKFITMNGICIWHESFHVRYNAAVERYQTTRNTLIARFTTGFAPKSDFLYELKNNVRLELKKFGYENAELVLDALEDVMKGPGFISEMGVAERTFMDANKNKEKLVPLAEVERQAQELGLDFKLADIDRQLIDGDKGRTFLQRLEDLATDNKQHLIVSSGSGYAVIPVQGWLYPAGVIRGKEYLIVVDWRNRVGAIRKKNPARYNEIAKRYKRDMKAFKKNAKRLEQEYAAARERMTSFEFWRHYLKMDETAK